MTRADARALMRLHVEALFTTDAAGRLVAVNEPGGAPAPRFFLGRTPDGAACWLRRDVDSGTAHELEELCRRQATAWDDDDIDATHFTAILARVAPVQRVWTGPAFCFPDALPDDDDAVSVTPSNAEILDAYLGNWRGDVAAGRPMFAALENGRAVSVCCSVRVTPHAHEAGVETHPDFRRRGHAAQVVSAWARAVRDMRAVPLYSTSWSNTASRAVAHTLGLRLFGTDLHIT